jgi:hypothetical protein
MSDRPKPTKPATRRKTNHCGPTGKIRFASHDAAVTRGIQVMPASFRVYQCPYCGGFHLTTKV